MRVFSEKWFGKYQARLLWLCNSPLTKRWFRWVLGITYDDFPLDKEIWELYPNRISHSFIWVNGENIQRTTEFKTGEPYARNLYYALKWMWWAMHFFDWIVLDRYVPDWSFGFNTLTVYPVSGGHALIQNYGGNYATMHNASTGNGTDTSSITFTTFENEWFSGDNNYYNRRATLPFDTSSLGSGATVTAATVSFYPTSGNDGQSDSGSLITTTQASATSASNSDFGSFGTTKYATDITIATILSNLNTYNTFTMTSYTPISVTGYSYLGFRSAKDISATAPPNQSRSYVVLNSGYNSSNQPKLVITYTPPYTTWTRAASVSVSNSSSRLASVAKKSTFKRSSAATVSNAASRLAAAVRGFVIKRSASATVSNAASRLATAAYTRAHLWIVTAAVSVSNAAGRLASVARGFVLKRAAVVSVSNAASRLATAIWGRVFGRKVSVSVSNSASRSATVARVAVFRRAASSLVSNAAGRLATVMVRLNGQLLTLWKKLTNPSGDSWHKYTNPSGDSWNKINGPKQ